MRSIFLSAVLAVAVFGALRFDQKSDTGSDEAQIRSLEAEETAALLRSDARKLDELWDDSLVVNSPLNSITRKADVLARIRERSIAYDSFVREIESVIVSGDTAIVMGSEHGTPAKTHVLGSRRLNRRFTNVWVRKNGTWKEIARQASLICE